MATALTAPGLDAGRAEAAALEGDSTPLLDTALDAGRADNGFGSRPRMLAVEGLDAGRTDAGALGCPTAIVVGVDGVRLTAGLVSLGAGAGAAAGLERAIGTRASGWAGARTSLVAPIA